MTAPAFRPTILFFDSIRGETHLERTTKYLGRDVGMHYYAGNADAFLEGARNSAGTWDILVVAARELDDAYNIRMLEEFAAANPGVIVAAFHNSAAEGGPDAAREIIQHWLEEPTDILTWLETMRSLIREAQSKRLGH